ncbi:MAG TPA: glycine cleavage system protein GcvH [Gammaproteobacteria bacterium]|jgi:glycine cleavage system H protein|nr:glycine cleavage system protein GcvH [Gammaproteobacteria bacterium]
MSNIPKQYQYTRSHEWIKKEEDYFLVGITDHAQTMLGDLVYVELPEADTHLEYGQECAVVESVKAAADIYSPLSGEIIEVNENVLDNPALINEDPYGKGWLFRMRPFDQGQGELLSADEYAKVVASEAH